MKSKEGLLSEEHLDFLAEMMNIGAGNAATALTQIFQAEVNIAIPEVKIRQSLQAADFYHDPSLLVLAVKMGMIGDVSGDIYFMVPDEDKGSLTYLAEQALLDESLIKLSRESREVILIENEFILNEDRIKTFFWLIPTASSVTTLSDSIEQARGY